METVREHAFTPWRDLDVLVAAEFDALEAHRPAALRRRQGPATVKAGESLDDLDAFDAAPDDEEAFIERTAAWLRDRADAEALLDAVRSALAEPAPDPTAPRHEEPEPGEVASAEPAAGTDAEPQAPAEPKPGAGGVAEADDGHAN